MRFRFISKVCEETVVKAKESKSHKRSSRIDKILTGKYTAIPSFILIMGLVFFLTFNVIGARLQSLLEMGIDKLGNLVDGILTSTDVNPVIHSLVIDGIFNGVGSVLSFLPIIVTLFFFLSLLEDSGYMARVAFVMDKLLRKIGLSGRSIVPMLIGFGCTVPAVMATRTLTSERDRKMTILLTPFMSCSAKLPIYSFFVSVIFPGKGRTDHVGIVSVWYPDGNSGSIFIPEHVIPGRTGAFCNGTAELPPAGSQKCRAAVVGKGKRLFTESIHCDLHCYHRGMVPAEL